MTKRKRASQLEADIAVLRKYADLMLNPVRVNYVDSLGLLKDRVMHSYFMTSDTPGFVDSLKLEIHPVKFRHITAHMAAEVAASKVLTFVAMMDYYHANVDMALKEANFWVCESRASIHGDMHTRVIDALASMYNLNKDQRELAAQLVED